MNEAIRGTDWSPLEVDQCVDSYFAHLLLDLSGQQFNKASLYRKLSEDTGRTPSSIEFKFQNISAVLSELGREWITGLAPMANYQRLLAEKIEVRLTNTALESQIAASTTISNALQDLASLYIEAPPERATKPVQLPDYMEALIRKFDPVIRDMRNREIGEAGEHLVFEYEKRFLKLIDRADLAENVRWVSKDDGDGAGYDILSFDDRGDSKFIEVKTTTGGNKTPFFISRNEHAFSKRESERYHLLRLFDFRRKPRAFELSGPLENYVRLSTETYRADFGA